MANIIEIKNLSFSYGKKKIFDNLSLNIKEGTFTTIIGNSSSGKSTLAKIMACILNSKSNIKVNGISIDSKNINKMRKTIGFVSDPVENLFVSNKVSDDIYFILKCYGYSKKDSEPIVKELIESLDIEYLLDLAPCQLSGGEKQLISILISLAHHPKLLIIDDGLTMLDSVKREKVFQILNKSNKNGLSIINITHDSEEILNGKEVIVIDNGKIILQSTVDDAFKHIDIFTDNKIALPFIVDLSIKLQYYQTINKIYFDSKQLVNDLWN